MSTNLSDSDILDSDDNTIEEISDMIKVPINNNDNNYSNNCNFTELCNALIVNITETYKNQKKTIKKLKHLYKKEIIDAKNKKKRKKRKMCTGFTTAKPVPNKLIKLLNLEKNAILSRTDITKKVYKYFQDEDLFDENDRRILRADNKIKKIFNLTDYVNKCDNPKDKNGLNFYNLQKYIAQCYKK